MPDRPLTMCVCFLLALVFSPGAIEGAAPIRRWAIVPSDNVQKTGMTDLLFARLAASGIELVEREELAKVTRELELPRYVGAGDASARLELGQKLKADALVLLSRKQRGEGDALEIVISETRSGARLYFDYFPYEPAKPKAMADTCAEQTLRISRHFADGIVMLVAVPPLISRDLSHRLDAWQSGFARTLQQGLAQYPGTAVVEVEEVQAIATELAGSDVADRVLPVIVEGEFSSTPARGEQPERLSLQLRVRDGEQKRWETKHEQLLTTEVVALLTNDIPKQILRSAEKATPLSPAAQIDALTARADRFSRVGDWQHAIDLRESALLIKPNLPDQRRKAIAEYLKVNEGRPWLGVPPANLVAYSGSLVSLWSRISGHLEYLVINGEVRGSEATELFRNVYQASSRMTYFTPQNKLRCPIEIIESKESMFWRVFPRITKPDPSFVSTGLGLITTFRDPRNSATEFHQEPDYDPREVLNHLERFLTEVCSAELITQESLDKSILGNILNFTPKPLKAKDVEQFILNLRESKQPAVQLYARISHAQMKLYIFDPPETVAELRTELKTLQKLATGQDTKTRLVVLSRQLELRSSGGVDGRLSLLNPKVNSSPAVLKPTQGRAEDKLTMQLIPDIQPDWIGLIAAGPQLDLMWNHHGVWRMEQPGKVEEIFGFDLKKTVLNSVAWDGHALWLATNDRGIIIISPTGKVLQTITAKQGLPEYSTTNNPFPQGVMLHAIERGKCLAVGRIGEHSRVWYATITWNDSEPEPPLIHVFHECAEIIGKDEQPPEDDRFRTHVPSWIYDMPAKRQRQILVGRYPFPFHLPQAYRPLAIDPRTLKVTSFSTSLRELGLFLPPLAPVAVNDGLLLATNTEVQLVEPLGKHGDSSQNKQIASCPLQFRVSMIHSRPLLPYKGKLLWPNLVWYRIDPETLKCERLNQEMPEQYRCNRFSISAHYGLVAWRDSYSSKDRGISKDAKPQFFQVKISD